MRECLKLALWSSVITIILIVCTVAAFGADNSGQIEWVNGEPDASLISPFEWIYGMIEDRGGDTPDSGYEVPLTDAWFYYTPTNAAQTNTIVDLSGQGNDGVVGGSSPATMLFIDNQTTEAPHIESGFNSAYDLTGITNSSGTYTLMTWLKSSTLSDVSYILGGETPRVILGWVQGTSGKLGYYDGSAGNRFFIAPPNDDTWHLLTIELDADNSTAKYFLDDATTPTSTNVYTSTSIGGGVGFMGDYTLTGGDFLAEVSSTIMYTGTVSTAARTNFWHNTRTSHGLPSYALNDPQRDSLEVEYSFEYDSAADTSGNENHGTISGATFDAANTNGFMDFDGVNDYVETGSSLSITGDMARTFSGWFKRNSVSGLDIFWLQGGAGLTRFDCYFAAGTDNLVLDKGGSAARWDNVGVVTGEWFHLAVTLGEGQDIDDAGVYINGVNRGANDSGTVGPANTTASVIRWCANNTPANPWHGPADDLKVWAAELSSNEVYTVYTNSLSVHP